MSNIQDRDEQKLAELGYKQELSRAWSSFSNFAISFTIISVLAGCFTTYGQAWNNGGPIAISWAWPIIGGIVLIIAFCMSGIVASTTRNVICRLWPKTTSVMTSTPRLPTINARFMGAS